MRLLLLISAALLSLPLVSMPTEQELAKADPLIQELMKDDLNALRTGKKTREQVGDAAAALAREAQSPAEKYLLFTGAFDQYMRGGFYDKADSALVALREAIPDWKASDEFSLIDKAMRSVAFGKGGPVRERHEALKGRQQYAAKLKKAQSLAQAKPTDKKLQFHVAAYSAALDDWPAALDAFIAGSNPACAAAAKLEKESAAPGQVADAWWSAADVKPEFLSSAIRAHAVDLYKKALAANSLAGLQKVAAEKRIKEFEAESVAEQPSTASSSQGERSTSRERAMFTGVKLVGSVKESAGVLSGFAGGSYALIEPKFSPAGAEIEAVIECTPGDSPLANCGVMGGLGWDNGFTPFYIVDQQACTYLSSGGGWDIATASKIGVTIKPKETCRLKCTWNKKEYVWYQWKGRWVEVFKRPSPKAVADGLQLQIGTNRGQNSPFLGTIDLNKCYIKIGGKLWWEGVKGAYKHANK